MIVLRRQRRIPPEQLPRPRRQFIGAGPSLRGIQTVLGRRHIQFVQVRTCQHRIPDQFKKRIPRGGGQLLID